ncbi:MAG: hypothetical protein ABIF88_00050 [archaeon]
MNTLETIMALQNQGMSDEQIVEQLQNEGIHPQEINDSLNQAKIKNAVSPPENQQQSYSQEYGQTSGQAMSPGQEFQQQYPPTQTPAYQAPPAPEIYEAPKTQDQYYQQTPQAYTGQTQPYTGQDYYSQAPDTETISEIVDQILSEKLGELREKINSLTTFKTIIQDKVADISERLKRIESSIDKLTNAVIGKIGEFGENTALIHKDLDNLHNTMSKLMNPLIDNVNEMKKANSK